MNHIYLDNAAATPLDPEVKHAMEPYEREYFGNPSSIHKKGQEAKRAVDAARKSIAQVLGSRPDEILFTSGATEADNLAVQGIARKYDKGHILTTPIEHRAILSICEHLLQEGRSVAYIPADQYGIVDVHGIVEMVKPETVLISINYANNEIGTIEPIADIARSIKKIRQKRVQQKNSTPLFFHTDASQAAEFLDIHAEKLGIDLMTLNAAKIYGPKGVGCLYMRRGVALEPILYGGGQERGLRSGTENVPGIVGFPKALEIAQKKKSSETVRLTELRDWFIKEIKKELPDAVLNGHPVYRLPNNIHISIPGIEGEALVLYLDAKGIYCSTGSACTSVSLEPSHVLRALGKPDEYTTGSLRFTLGRGTTKKDLEYVLKVLQEVVIKLQRS